MLFGFWAYHLYLAGTNSTTNESFKWSDAQELVRSLKNAHAKNIKVKPNDKLSAKEKEQIMSLDEKVRTNGNLNNMYDLGFFRNLMQVIKPPSLYKNSVTHVSQSKFMPARSKIE